ncbi:hypothetical protein DY000_02027610 [Brassica cretica]|uniref:Transmembrane protein n=1 Tax=Brassica cretica TaxID=69181 RepID=A0ABQ7EAJ7_BRACR|nr:hypothetical protein DY000_02027610 [Brassica cretica]
MDPRKRSKRKTELRGEGTAGAASNATGRRQTTISFFFVAREEIWHLLVSSLWCEVSRRSYGFDLRLFSCEDVTTLLLCGWFDLVPFLSWVVRGLIADAVVVVIGSFCASVLGYDWRPGAVMDFGLSSFDL